MAVPGVHRRKVGRNVAAVYAWYNGQRDDLGEELLAAVAPSIDTIERYPDTRAKK